jgi:hypothetical protein
VSPNSKKKNTIKTKKTAAHGVPKKFWTVDKKKGATKRKRMTGTEFAMGFFIALAIVAFAVAIAAYVKPEPAFPPVQSAVWNALSSGRGPVRTEGANQSLIGDVNGSLSFPLGDATTSSVMLRATMLISMPAPANLSFRVLVNGNMFNEIQFVSSTVLAFAGAVLDFTITPGSHTATLTVNGSPSAVDVGSIDGQWIVQNNTIQIACDVDPGCEVQLTGAILTTGPQSFA